MHITCTYTPALKKANSRTQLHTISKQNVAWGAQQKVPCLSISGVHTAPRATVAMAFYAVSFAADAGDTTGESRSLPALFPNIT